ncbi:hypothetical protein CDL12_26021 [Handroanthus impetiginosus]|uniref:B30.2/SPRY domain-containing protein n=1 Tax=Handroanthus impetiginosus TaxID=429701 RepID=A0A2G9G860_9LAMI|nr:hypothetical protein CDL12_26021 [Handroanthus impetiginosus]
MENLQAAYCYDEDDDASEVPLPPPQPTTASDGGTTGAISTSVVVAEVKPDLPQNDHLNGIKDEIGATASKGGFSKENSLNGISQTLDAHHEQRYSQISPNLPTETDAAEKGEEGEEEEEPPLKKQKQLPDLPNATTSKLEITEMSPPYDTIPPQPRSGKPPTGKKSKKKKSKDVWATSSRKGKKKTKHASISDRPSKKIIPLTEGKVLLTPMLAYPQRNDDCPDLKICLSKIFKAEKVELSEDRLAASSTKGFRMVRATRGVTDGAWYFEIKVVHLGETGHTRLGWSTEKGDLQAPVGFDANSYGYRDIDGSKVHKALRDKYGDEGYKQGDVIGFYINLPDGGSYLPNPQDLVLHKGQDPPNVPGSEISYFKNGVCQGVAFGDIYAGCYYPAASMYTLPNQPACVVKFNFGPDFERFPGDFGERPVPRPMIEVPYQSYDCRVENGGPWNITRTFPMLKVIKGENSKFVTAAEIVG